MGRELPVKKPSRLRRFLVDKKVDLLRCDFVFVGEQRYCQFGVCGVGYRVCIRPQ